MNEIAVSIFGALTVKNGIWAQRAATYSASWPSAGVLSGPSRGASPVPVPITAALETLLRVARTW